MIPNERSWQQINSENKGEMLNFHPQIPIKNHAEKGEIYRKQKKKKKEIPSNFARDLKSFGTD